MEVIKINVTLSNSDGKWSVSDGLVFNLEDVKRLRKLGICGVLSGSLPTLAQQNVFLSVPLRLCGDEILWLISNGYGELNVSDTSTIPLLLRSAEVKDQISRECKAQLAESFELQRQMKLEELLRKRHKYGVGNSSLDVPTGSLFQEVPNESAILKLNKNNQEKATELLQKRSGRNFNLFCNLKEKNFVISPGARFGGKYIIYPGDPLRFHSHLIVSDTINYYKDPIDFHNIINGARLATSVKKTWVVNGRKENDIEFFSIEWAGFG